MEHTTHQKVQELKQQLKVASDQLRALGIAPDLTPEQQGMHEANVFLARSEGYVKGYARAVQELSDNSEKGSDIIIQLILLLTFLSGAATAFVGMDIF